MIINFNDIENTKIEHFNGGEGFISARMFNDEKNRIMKGKLEPGCSIGLHKHEINSEILYVLKGKGKCLWTESMKKFQKDLFIIARKVMNIHL